MSYALSGVNFTDQPFTPTSDCAIWRRCISDGILDGMAITYSGSSLNVAAGWLMAGGKQLQLPSAITVPVTDAVSGKARLVVTVDLTKTATEQTFNQGCIDLEYQASYSTLTQQNLAASGTKYKMVLVEVTLGSSGITGIVHTCGFAHAQNLGVAVTLAASAWNNNQQTVRCDGATASNLIEASGALASLDAYRASDVRLSGQALGSITFTCASVPEVDLTVNVRIS